MQSSQGLGPFFQIGFLSTDRRRDSSRAVQGDHDEAILAELSILKEDRAAPPYLPRFLGRPVGGCFFDADSIGDPASCGERGGERASPDKRRRARRRIPQKGVPEASAQRDVLAASPSVSCRRGPTSRSSQRTRSCTPRPPSDRGAPDSGSRDPGSQDVWRCGPGTRHQPKWRAKGTEEQCDEGGTRERVSDTTTQSKR